MMCEIEFSGDFGHIDCPNCYRKTTVTIKDELLEAYYCAYCGLQIKVEAGEK